MTPPQNEGDSPEGGAQKGCPTGGTRMGPQRGQEGLGCGVRQKWGGRGVAPPNKGGGSPWGVTKRRGGHRKGCPIGNN